MRHRGGSKIKYEHHMINGLRALLEEIESWSEIRSIIPGRIKPRKGSGGLVFKVQYQTPTGVKCLVHSGTSVQEVFFVTDSRDELERRLRGTLSI